MISRRGKLEVGSCLCVWRILSSARRFGGVKEGENVQFSVSA
jgi:hypothetical protein